MSDGSILETMAKYQSKFTYGHFNHGQIYMDEVREFLEDLVESVDESEKNEMLNIMRGLSGEE